MARKTKLLIIGEAWGRSEEETGIPFSGATGQQFRNWALQAGLNVMSPHVRMTNVFNRRPPWGGDVSRFCGAKREGIPGLKPLLYSPMRYVLPKFQSELDQCWQEIIDYDPNLILALGNTPLWLLKAGKNSITTERGYVFNSIRHPDAPRTYKVLPSFHPAYVNRAWADRVYLLHDLHRATVEMEYAETRYTERELWINPGLEDLEEFARRYLTPSPDLLSVDIETGMGQITEISLAPSPYVSICVPFIKREGSPDGNYWPDLASELAAVEWCKHHIRAARRVLGQNFSYDFKWLWNQWLFPVSNYSEDTMVLAHAREPELRKSIQILASVYANEGSWKHMRKETQR